jgi:hypothetical protein
MYQYMSEARAFHGNPGKNPVGKPGTISCKGEINMKKRMILCAMLLALGMSSVLTGCGSRTMKAAVQARAKVKA